jgi:acyl carrier protein
MDMESTVRQFVLESLKRMNYDVSEVVGDTDLGPAGLDLESVAVAELAVLVEDEFHVAFTEEDTERLALMTIDEFATEVAGRLAAAGADSGGTADAM